MFSQIPTPFGGTETWAQFGLAGLVIFALFVCLYLLGKALINRMNKSEEERQNFLKDLMSQHRTERQEWRMDFERNREAHTAALEKLSNATVDAIQGVQTELVALRKSHEVQVKGT